MSDPSPERQVPARPERLSYAYTCFLDPTHGATAPWVGSPSVADRQASWAVAGLEVRHMQTAILKMRAASSGDESLGAEGFVASQGDLWWIASRAPDGASPLLDPPPDGDYMQHIVVRVSPDPNSSTITGGLTRDGPTRELVLEVPASALEEVDDLCWFDGLSVGFLAMYLVVASKLRTHRLLRDRLRAPGGEPAVQADVLEPLDAHARVLLERSREIEDAQRARALARPGDRKAAARLVGSLSNIREAERTDRLYTALMVADRDIHELGHTRRSATTLARNIERRASPLSGRVRTGLFAQDRQDADDIAFEFDLAYEKVKESLASVARGQDRVGKLLAEREQELAEERTRSVELQTAVLAAVGLLIASIQAGGVVKGLSAVIGASGLLIGLFVNGHDGYGLRHRAAVAVVTGATAGTVVGIIHFHGKHAAAIVGLTLAGTALGWLATGIRPAWFDPSGSAMPDRAARTTIAVGVVAVIVEWAAFGGDRHVDSVAGATIAIAAGACVMVETAVRVRTRRRNGGTNRE